MQKSKIQLKSQKFGQLLFESFDKTQDKLRRELFSVKLLDSFCNSELARRIAIILFTSLFGFFFHTQTVLAHTLKVDGTFGVTVHVEPDDAPKAGEASTIFVALKDRAGRFDERNPVSCTCILTIRKDDKVLSTMPVNSGNAYNALVYTFPEAGPYEFTVSGKPSGQGTPFPPFETVFHYYVTSSTGHSIYSENPLQRYLPFVIVVVGFVIIFMFVNPFSKLSQQKKATPYE